MKRKIAQKIYAKYEIKYLNPSPKLKYTFTNIQTPEMWLATFPYLTTQPILNAHSKVYPLKGYL